MKDTKLCPNNTIKAPNYFLRQKIIFKNSNFLQKEIENRSIEKSNLKNNNTDKTRKKINLIEKIILLILILNLNINIINSRILLNIINISKSSIIKLKIYGTGIQSIISSDYNNIPDKIIINEIEKEEISKSYNLESENNTIELIWDNPITDCSNMFKDCSKIYEIDFTEFDASNIVKMNQLFRGCSSLKSVNLSNWNVQNNVDLSYLFYECTSLESIEMPHIENWKVTKMNHLVYNCKSLTSLNISNFDTSKVTKMDNVFYNCRLLTSLNLSNFDTSQVTIMRYMFYNCRSLTSLNLSNFNMYNTTSIVFMFGNCYNLEYINLQNANLKSDVAKDYVFTDLLSLALVVCTESPVLEGIVPKSDCASLSCSENWREYQKKVNLETGSCVDNCIQVNYKYDYLSKCYESCPNGTYEINDFKCEKCHPDCETCEAGPTLSSSNCKSCLSPEKYLQFGNCISSCKNGFYLDPNDPSIQVCKCDLDKCNICSEESYNMDLCISCNDNYYQKYNDSTNYNSYVNCYKDPEGYYFDEFNLIYKPCYLSCKSCDSSGNELEHNCKICKNDYNYIFYISGSSYINCYIECNYYYYINEYNNSVCTENEICPEQFNKLIKEKRKCIDDCKNDELYKYEYDNICYIECPLGTINNETNNICFNETYITYLNETNIPYTFETYISSRNEINFTDFNEINNSNFKETLIKSSFNYIEENNYPETTNIILPFSSIINLKETNEADNITHHTISTQDQTTTSKNFSADINNLTFIDLNGCEEVLREEYKINENESLIILIKEKETNKISEKNITFEVYEPINRTKLNLSLCIGIEINIYIKSELREETKKLFKKLRDLGYNMFNINDKFYHDICSPYTTKDKTDIILMDRIEYIYNNEDTRCQKNCKFDGYSIETNYVNCTCDIYKDVYDNEDNEYKKDKIFESFFDVLKYSNYKILKCYHLIFSKKTFTKNMGSIILLIYFLIYLGCLLTFIVQGINPLKIKLLKNMKNDDIFDLNETIKEININDKKHFTNNKSPMNPTRKTILNINSNSKLNIKFNKQKTLTKKTQRRKSKSRTTKKKKSCVELYSNMNLNDYTKNKINNRLSIVKSNTLKENINKSKNKKKGDDNKIQKYDSFELYELEYLEAIKNDKRSFIQIYWDTLKREHIIFFTFFVCNDYNLLYIKIIRFLYLTSTDMAMNVFFFSDESMHKIYVTYGKFDFIQQIEQIFYSTLVSQLMEVFLCFLSLTDKHIYQIKRLMKAKILDDKNKIFKVFSCIKIKLVIFYFFSCLLFVCYWYIVSSFCAVYENTQIIFIKDCLFSFLFNLLFPIFIYLIPCGLRYCAIKDQKGRMACLYKLSDIIPFF